MMNKRLDSAADKLFSPTFRNRYFWHQPPPQPIRYQPPPQTCWKYPPPQLYYRPPQQHIKISRPPELIYYQPPPITYFKKMSSIQYTYQPPAYRVY